MNGNINNYKIEKINISEKELNNKSKEEQKEIISKNMQKINSDEQNITNIQFILKNLIVNYNKSIIRFINLSQCHLENDYSFQCNYNNIINNFIGGEIHNDQQKIFTINNKSENIDRYDFNDNSVNDDIINFSGPYKIENFGWITGGSNKLLNKIKNDLNKIDLIKQLQDAVNKIPHPTHKGKRLNRYNDKDSDLYNREIINDTYIKNHLLNKPVYIFSANDKINKIHASYVAARLLKYNLIELSKKNDYYKDNKEHIQKRFDFFKSCGIITKEDSSLIVPDKASINDDIKNYDIKIHNFNMENNDYNFLSNIDFGLGKDGKPEKIIEMMGDDVSRSWIQYTPSRKSTANLKKYPHMTGIYDDYFPTINQDKDKGDIINYTSPRHTHMDPGENGEYIYHEINEYMDKIKREQSDNDYYLLEFRHRDKDTQTNANEKKESIFYLIEINNSKTLNEFNKYTIMIHMKQFKDNDDIYQLTENIKTSEEIYPLPIIDTKYVVFDKQSKNRYDYINNNKNFINNLYEIKSKLFNYINDIVDNRKITDAADTMNMTRKEIGFLSTKRRTAVSTAGVSAFFGLFNPVTLTTLGIILLGGAATKYGVDKYNSQVAKNSSVIFKENSKINDIYKKIEIEKLGLIDIKDTKKKTLELFYNSNLLGINSNFSVSPNIDSHTEDEIIQKYIEITEDNYDRGIFNRSTNSKLTKEQEKLKELWISLRKRYILDLKNKINSYSFPIILEDILKIENYFKYGLENRDELINYLEFKNSFNELNSLFKKGENINDIAEQIDTECLQFYGINKSQMVDNLYKSDNIKPDNDIFAVPQFYWWVINPTFKDFFNDEEKYSKKLTASLFESICANNQKLYREIISFYNGSIQRGGAQPPSPDVKAQIQAQIQKIEAQEGRRIKAVDDRDTIPEINSLIRKWKQTLLIDNIDDTAHQAALLEDQRAGNGTTTSLDAFIKSEQERLKQAIRDDAELQISNIPSGDSTQNLDENSTLDSSSINLIDKIRNEITHINANSVVDDQIEQRMRDIRIDQPKNRISLKIINNDIHIDLKIEIIKLYITVEGARRGQGQVVDLDQGGILKYCLQNIYTGLSENDSLFCIRNINRIIRDYNNFNTELQKIHESYEGEKKSLLQSSESIETEKGEDKKETYYDKLLLYDKISQFDDIYKEFTYDNFGNRYGYFYYGPKDSEKLNTKINYDIPYYFFGKKLLSKSIDIETNDYLSNVLPLLPIKNDRGLFTDERQGESAYIKEELDESKIKDLYINSHEIGLKEDWKVNTVGWREVNNINTNFIPIFGDIGSKKKYEPDNKYLFYENNEDYKVLTNNKYKIHDNYFRLKYKINKLHDEMFLHPQSKYYKYYVTGGKMDIKQYQFFSNFINYVLPIRENLMDEIDKDSMESFKNLRDKINMHVGFVDYDTELPVLEVAEDIFIKTVKEHDNRAKSNVNLDRVSQSENEIMARKYYISNSFNKGFLHESNNKFATMLEIPEYFNMIINTLLDITNVSHIDNEGQSPRYPGIDLHENIIKYIISQYLCRFEKVKRETINVVADHIYNTIMVKEPDSMHALVTKILKIEYDSKDYKDSGIEVINNTIKILNILYKIKIGANTTGSAEIDKAYVIKKYHDIVGSSGVHNNSDYEIMKINLMNSSNNNSYVINNISSYDPIDNNNYWVKPSVNENSPHIDYIRNKLKIKYLIDYYFDNKIIYDNNVKMINAINKKKFGKIFKPNGINELFKDITSKEKSNKKKRGEGGEGGEGGKGDTGDKGDKGDKTGKRSRDELTDKGKKKNKFKVGDKVLLPDDTSGKIVSIDGEKYFVKKESNNIVIMKESSLRFYDENYKKKAKSNIKIGDSIIVLSNNKDGEVIGLTSINHLIIKLGDGTVIVLHPDKVRKITKKAKKGDIVKSGDGKIGEIIGITPSGDYVLKMKDGTVITISNRKSIEKVKITEEKKEYTDITKLEGELKSLMDDKKLNEKLIIQLNEDLRNFKLEKHGMESEERQKRLRDYERKQKELNYIKNSLYLKNKQVESFKLLIEKEIERKKIVEENILKRETINDKRNIEAMKKKMYDISKKEHDRNLKLRTQQKDEEIELLKNKNKEYVKIMKKNKISLNKYKKEESIDESIPIYSIKRTPKKIKRKKSNKKKTLGKNKTLPTSK